MDNAVRQELVSLVEQLTHSGAPSLNEGLMKRVKGICKSSDAYVRTAYEQVMSHLGKQHAEIRLSAFQVISELFLRSHIFRELLISEFQKFVRLVTETDPKHPLPLPKMAAQQLKKKSLLAIRGWHERFGEGYPKLKLGFNYLKYNKKVNFDQLVAQSEAARRRQQERETRQRAMLQQRVQEVKQEMRGIKFDIEDCLQQMDACFNLLLPRFDIREATNPLLSGSEEQTSKEVHHFRQRNISSESFYSLSSSDGEDDSFYGDGGGDIELSEVKATEGTVGESSAVKMAVGEGLDTSVLQAGERKDDGAEATSIFQTGEGSEIEDDGAEATSIFQTGEGSEIEDDGAEATSIFQTGEGREKDQVDAQTGEGGGGCLPGTSSESQRHEEYDSSMEDSDSDSEVEWEEVSLLQDSLLLQEHGFASRGYSIPIELSAKVEVCENDDNSSIITTLQETYHLLREKFIPTVNRWIEWFTKAGEEASLKAAIDVKNKLLSTQRKYNRLNITTRTAKSISEEKSPSPPPPPPGEVTKKSSAQWTITSPHSMPDPELELDPTTPQAQIAILRRKIGLSNHPPSAPPITSTQTRASTTVSAEETSKKDLFARAPVVPFGMDLYHWDSSLGPPVIPVVQSGSLHTFWIPESDLVIPEDEKARMKCRTISFSGKFEPIKWACRAPLPSGKLCPRRDRFKCPLHGPVVPRDENGTPVDPVPTTMATSSGSLNSIRLRGSTEAGPSWQDIQSDVLRAKGIEPVESKKRKGKGKQQQKNPYPGLTDLKVHTNTPRRRMERRILDKKAIRRVADAMDEMSAKRFQDKFGYSFNYAYKK